MMRREVVIPLLVILAMLACVTGCATTALTPVERLGELTRGVSTKADVQRTIGPPHGEGGAAFPPEMRADADRYDLWYYYDTQKKPADNDKRIELRLPRMLLVFFDGDLFQGFMWFDLIGASVERVGERY